MNILELAEFEELNAENFIDRPCDVTILVNVYNFGRFLPDALDGIISQKCDYTMEILIHDDGSTDDSAEIIRRYSREYPDLIHAFIGHRNVYGTLSISEGVEFEQQWMKRYINGKLVAYCEGDDYWTDPNKLQLQVDYMLAHPSCSLTMHDAELLNCMDGSVKRMKEADSEHDIGMEEILSHKTGIWPTASMVFTRDVALCPAYYIECGVGDWPRQLYAGRIGTIHYFDRCMSVYRYMHKNSWSADTYNKMEKRLDHVGKMVEFLKKFIEEVDDDLKKEVIERINRFYSDSAYAFFQSGMPVEWLETYADEKGESSKAILDMYRQVFDKKYVAKEVKELSDKADELYIYGHGDYAALITEQLKNNGISIAGYLVSDDKGNEGEDIQSIAKFKGDLERVAVVVGVGFDAFRPIYDNLQKYKVRNYVFPFVIGYRKWFK